MKVNTQFTISLKCSQWAGPQNYYVTLDRNTLEPSSDMFALGTVIQNDVPLVAVEISKYYTLDFTM